MAAKSQELIVRVTTQADQAKRDLAQLDKAAKDAEKPIVLPVKADGVDKVEADLKGVGEAAEQAARKVEDVGKGGVGGGRLKPAVQEVDEATKTLNRSAEGSKNAFANLVGNSAQDIGSLLGPLGSVGVALGQVAEYTTDAANESGNLTSALKGAALQAAPIAGLSVALLIVNNLIQDYQKRQQEIRKAQEQGSAAFVKATSDVEEWGKALDDAFSSGTADKVQTLNKVVKDALGKDTTDKILQNLVGIGKGADDLGDTMLSVDQDFRTFASGLLIAAGATQQQADAIVDMVKDTDSAKTAIGLLNRQGIDVEKLGVKDLVTNLADLNQEARKQDFEKYANDALNAAAAIGDQGEAVKAARDATTSATDAWKLYEQGQVDAKKAAAELARQNEIGAKAAADAGGILEQVARKVADAEQAAADAAAEAKKKQDDWLVQNVDYEAKVDGFTESLQALTEQTKKQAEAGDEGAGSFEGNTKAALDNRDALRDVYSKATDVIQGMKDAGFSVDGARQAQDNMAQSAYDLAIKMGYPITKAEEIRDRIKQIPPSVTSEVIITEQGAAEVKAVQEGLDHDIYSTWYVHGVLDKSVVDAVNKLPPGAFGVSVVPGAAPGPSAGLRAAPAPVAAPMAPGAAPAASSASRTMTVSQPIVVNVNAGLVADTFQLQRAVVRSARSFQRLAGKRAA